ncbi:MAG TPA: hypothetical protein VF278_06000 [Pirellulales bacterium]
MEVALVQSAMPASDDARFAVSIRALREAGAVVSERSSLSLYDVPISSAMLASLKKLPNLRSLVISGAVLADEALSRITGLRQLERLQLENVAGSRTVLHQIQALPNLKQLKLTPATTHEDAVRERHPGDFDARQ